MWRTLIVLAGTIVGFLFHTALGLEAATIALLGATVLMLIGPIDPHDALADVEWPTLFFFIGLFVLVEAVVEVGIVGGIAGMVADAAGGDPAVASLSLLWFSAFASAIVDNIPYTATAIPLVQELAAGGLPAEPLWWSLALGACLGGNLTVVGASANIVTANIAARDGQPISFAMFLRYGIPVVGVSLADLDRRTSGCGTSDPRRAVLRPSRRDQTGSGVSEPSHGRSCRRVDRERPGRHVARVGRVLVVRGFAGRLALGLDARPG